MSSQWEIITVTSGDQDSATDSTISASLNYINSNGSAALSNSVSLNNANSLHSNVFQRGYFDRFLVDFDIESSITPTEILIRNTGNDMWRGLRIYVMEQSSGRIYSTREEAFEIDGNSGEVSLSLPLQRCIKDPENVEAPLAPKTSTFNVRVKTESVNSAGTNDQVYCKLISKDGYSSDLYKFNHIGNDFQEGADSLYRVELGRELSRIDYVLFFKDGIQGWLPSEAIVHDASVTPTGYPTTSAKNINAIWLNGSEHGKQDYLQLETVIV